MKRNLLKIAMKCLEINLHKSTQKKIVSLKNKHDRRKPDYLKKSC